MPQAKEPHLAVKTWRRFKVVSVSSNANAFGLYGHVLVDSQGHAWEVGRSRGAWLKPWNKGDEVRLDLDRDGVPDWAAHGCEIPRRFVPDIPMKLVKEVWGK